MMDYTTGLSPLVSTFEALSRQLQDYGLKIAALHDAVARKADSASVEALSSKVALLATGLDDKAEFCEVKQCHDTLQTLTAAVSGKVDFSKFDQWDHRLLSLESFVQARKLEVSKIEAFEKQVNDISFSVKALENHKAEFKEVEQLHADVMHVKSSLGLKADAGCVDKLDVAVRELATACSQKADSGVIETLHSQYRSVNTALAAKAEFGEMNQVKAQLQSLVGGLPTKTYAGELDRLRMQMDELAALRATPSLTSPSVEALQQHLYRLEDAVAKKADRTAVSEFYHQLSASHNLPSHSLPLSASHSVPAGFVPQRLASPPPSRHLSPLGSPTKAPIGGLWQPSMDGGRLRNSLRPHSAARRNRLAKSM